MVPARATLKAVRKDADAARAERDAMPGAALATIMARQLAKKGAPTRPATPNKALTDLERLRADEPQTSAQVIGHHEMPEAPPEQRLM